MKLRLIILCALIFNLAAKAEPGNIANSTPWDDASLVDELGASRNGLNEFWFKQMTPDQLGWMDMNPYALKDLGYITDISDDLAAVHPKLVPLMLSTWGSGRDIKTYFRTREGRAKPLAPHYMATHHSPELGVTRLMQKGGLPTGTAGGHKDGLLDLSEAYGDMIWGELLHQLGAFSTRGLLAVRQQGVRRNMPGGPGLDAGIMIRFNELPRLKEPQGWNNNYQDEMLRTINYKSPLIISGLETLDPKQANWFIALQNEALLKDHWILHGSYTFDENRSASLIDFGTTAALWEPNPEASLGYTSWAMEIDESGEKAMERMGDGGRDVPEALRTVKVRGVPVFNNVFWSSYAFYQLRRMGLTDQEILNHFTKEKLPGTDFQFYLANPETLKFMKAIAEIDKQTMHSLDVFTVDWQDGKSVRTNQRVLVNTRKLLNAILDKKQFNNKNPTETDLRDLLRSSFFGTHSGNLGPDHTLGLLDQDPGKRDYIYAKMREIISYAEKELSPALNKDYAGVKKRAAYYPTEQNLPYRREVMDTAWGWANNPGSFGKQFIPWIEKRVPQEGPVAEMRRQHLLNQVSVPTEPPRDYFRKLYTCLNALKAASTQTPKQ